MNVELKCKYYLNSTTSTVRQQLEAHADYYSVNIGDRYSIALLVFFITYFIFEIPSNLVLRKVGAANWLSFLCMSWGLVIFGAGFAKKWEVRCGPNRDIQRENTNF
jgi:hypothetical protein